jgi:phage regulator Rha-like protein
MKTLMLAEEIEKRIYFIRGAKVMLDSDLAELYGVQTKYLTRQVRRNKKRFPDDFMFILKKEEFLRCQIDTSKRGGRRYMPYVFTEHGVAMLATVLNSEKAIQVNIAIMRAFVKLRRVLSANRDLANRLYEVEKKVVHHDADIRSIFEVIKQLMNPPDEPTKKIGYIKDNIDV